jgi:hypothetical protein
MKYTIVIAALFGYATAIQDDTTKVWELRSVKDHRTDAALQDEFGNTATGRANARPPLRSHVMINDPAAAKPAKKEEEKAAPVA